MSISRQLLSSYSQVEVGAAVMSAAAENFALVRKWDQLVKRFFLPALEKFSKFCHQSAFAYVRTGAMGVVPIHTQTPSLTKPQTPLNKRKFERFWLISP